MSDLIDEPQLRTLEAVFCRAHKRPAYWLGVSTPWGAAGSLLGKILKYRDDHCRVAKITQTELREYAETDRDLSLSRNSWSRFLCGTEKRAGDKWSSSIRELLLYSLLGSESKKLPNDPSVTLDSAKAIRVAHRIVDFFFPPDATNYSQLGVQWYLHPSLQYTEHCATPAEARAELRAIAWGARNGSVHGAVIYRTFCGKRFLQVTEAGEPCKSFWPMLRTLESGIHNYYIAYEDDDDARRSFDHIHRLVENSADTAKAALSHLRFVTLSAGTQKRRHTGEYLSPFYRYIAHSWRESGKHRFNFMVGRSNDIAPSLFMGKKHDYESFESWLVAMGIPTHTPQREPKSGEQSLVE